MRPFVLIVLVQIFIQAAFKADQWDAAIALISWLHGVSGEILHEGHLLSAGSSDEACEVINPWSDPVSPKLYHRRPPDEDRRDTAAIRHGSPAAAWR